MLLDAIIIASFIGTISLLIFSVVYISYIYKKDQALETKRKEVLKNSQDILNHAQKRAEEILEQSTQKAQQILMQTNYVKEDMTQNLDKTLHTVIDQNSTAANQNSQQLMNEYKSSLVQLKTQYLKEIEDMLGKMEGSVETEFSDFKQTLEKEAKQAEETLAKNINSELEKAKIEAQEYKQAQIKKIDEQVKTVVLKLSQEVLGKTINLSDQEKLIMNALEEAKKEGLFN